MGILLGAFGGAILAVLSIRLNVNQIVAGIAINLVALGLTAFLARLIFGLDATTKTLAGFTAWAIPGLSAIPFVGPIFFNQDPLVYVLYLLVPFLYWLLYRSAFGLEIRATGENPGAADSRAFRSIECGSCARSSAEGSRGWAAPISWFRRSSYSPST